MKRHLTTIALAAAGLSVAFLSSCVTTGPSLQPRADVEAVERQAPTTPTPNVGQHEAGRNAVDYSNDRRYRYGYPYGYRYY